MPAHAASRRRRVRSLLRRVTRSGVPLLIWLGAVVCVLALLPGRATRLPIPGIVETQRYDVVAALDGRLTAVMVGLHDRVASGQVVARLSDEDLRLRLTQARCELEALRADVASRQAELAFEVRADDARHQLDAAVEARRRVSEAETAHLDALMTRAEIEEAKVRLQGTTIEVERLSRLEVQAITSDSAMVVARTEQKALEKRISELEQVLSEQRARAEATRARLASFTAGAAGAMPEDPLLAPMRWRLKVQEAELERIALENRALDVVAPAGGHVESVRLRAGQWIASGDTLLTIVDPDARRILAYLPEVARQHVAVASELKVMRDANPGTLRAASVVSLSPALVLVPQRLWRDPRVEEWAIEAILRPAGDELPGERVSLLLPQ